MNPDGTYPCCGMPFRKENPLTNPTPADLAKFIHPVPVGATIPAGTPYRRDVGRILSFWLDGTSVPVTQESDTDILRWTAEPIPAPLPPLPTEPGSIIANVSAGSNVICAVMARGLEAWVGVDTNGYFHAWGPEDITAWAPARIVTDEPDLIDESDKRARIDSDGDRAVWDGGHWAVCIDDDSAYWHAATLAEYCRRFNVTITAFA